MPTYISSRYTSALWVALKFREGWWKMVKELEMKSYGKKLNPLGMSLEYTSNSWKGVVEKIKTVLYYLKVADERIIVWNMRKKIPTEWREVIIKANYSGGEPPISDYVATRKLLLELGFFPPSSVVQWLYHF